MIVVDASAMMEWLMQSHTGVKVDRIIVAHADEVHAPHLLDVEVAHTVRRHVRLGALNERRAQQALWDLVHVQCVRHEPYPFLPRIWELRDNLSAYDAVYVALAEFLGATLVTTDSKLASAPGHRARVRLVT